MLNYRSYMRTHCFFLFIFIAKSVFAFHPLITDDAPTIGKGVIQFEVSGEYGRDRVNSSLEQSMMLSAIPAYGILENLDLFLGINYSGIWPEQDKSASGIGDIFLESKWNFFNWKSFSFTFKPGITFPTGDYAKGFGAGKCGYYILLLTTVGTGHAHFHINFGYTRNENKLQELEDIWHISAALEFDITREFCLVADIGAERNPDPSDRTVPCFLLAGFLWSPSKDADFDIAYKYGITEPEPDHTFIIGATVRF